MSVAVLALVAALAGSRPAAQSSTDALPLVGSGDFSYLGSFSLPVQDGRGGQLSYGGHALGIGADGRSLYFSCIYATSLARVEIPGIGDTARVLDPCEAVPNLRAINANDPANVVGGVLAWNGRLVVSAYSSYDASRAATRSHFAGGSIGGLQGPYAVGTDRAGLVGGYMGVVPQEWRAALGGPALTGQCCISIISRTSYGPSVSVFDPAQVGSAGPAPSTLLVGYPDEHQSLGPYDGANPYYGGGTNMGGVGFPAGSRSVLFVGRIGSTYCYGNGSTNPADHNRSINGEWTCYDPTSQYKGPHGYPYRHMVWAYDARDLVAVKDGRMAAWDVRPYAAWPLDEMTPSPGAAQVMGAVYDPATRRFYITTSTAPDVHVYELRVPGTGAPAEVCGDGVDNDGDGAVDEECGIVPDPSGGGTPGGDQPGDGMPGGDETGRGPEGDTAGPGWEALTVLAPHGVTTPALAACGTSVHVAYGDGALYYRRATSDGAVWLPWQQFGDGRVTDAHALACDGLTVALTVTRGGDAWTWVSHDAGATWLAPVKVSADGAVVRAATAVEGDVVTVAWVQRDTSGAWTVAARRMEATGVWGSETVTTASPAGAEAPMVVLERHGHRVAWGVSDASGSAIATRRALGASWSATARVAGAGGRGTQPLAVDGDVMVAARATSSGADLLTSSDGGGSWTSRLALPGQSVTAPPVVASMSPRLAVVWPDAGLRVGVSLDGGASWHRTALPTAGAVSASLAWSLDALHVVSRDASGQLTYARRPAR